MNLWFRSVAFGVRIIGDKETIQRIIRNQNDQEAIRRNLDQSLQKNRLISANGDGLEWNERGPMLCCEALLGRDNEINGLILRFKCITSVSDEQQFEG